MERYNYKLLNLKEITISDYGEKEYKNILDKGQKEIDKLKSKKTGDGKETEKEIKQSIQSIIENLEFLIKKIEKNIQGIEKEAEKYKPKFSDFNLFDYSVSKSESTYEKFKTEIENLEKAKYHIKDKIKQIKYILSYSNIIKNIITK
jgi:uncharacterized protein YukE